MKLSGYGSAVIANLIKAGLKKNLYYEIKDVVVEERQDGIHSWKNKIRTKVFGLNSTKSVRKELIDLLIERVERHKDKFVSPIIYNELLGMQVKKNGKVEHSDTTHDDQVFSMLMALWVWYNGTNLAERYGIKKSSIRTDDEIDEAVDYFNPETTEIVGSFNDDGRLDGDDQISQTAKLLESERYESIKTYLEKRHEIEEAQFRALVMTPLGQKAFRDTYNIPKDQPVEQFIISAAGQQSLGGIPDEVFEDFYNIPLHNRPLSLSDTQDNQPGQIAVPESMAFMLEDDNYRYSDHFNF